MQVVQAFEAVRQDVFDGDQRLLDMLLADLDQDVVDFMPTFDASQVCNAGWLDLTSPTAAAAAILLALMCCIAGTLYVHNLDVASSMYDGYCCWWY